MDADEAEYLDNKLMADLANQVRESVGPPFIPIHIYVTFVST